MYIPEFNRIEDRALALAIDRAAQAALRSKLALHRDSYPLFDVDRFRIHLEAAYSNMRDRHQAGLPPSSFPVAPDPISRSEGQMRRVDARNHSAE